MNYFCCVRKRNTIILSKYRINRLSYHECIFNWLLIYWSGQVRSGQSGLTCTFRASCCCARLSRAQVPVSLFGTRKKKGGGGSSGGTTCTGGYKGVQEVRPESVAGGGWFEVLWNLECPVGLSQKQTCAHFNDGNLAQFGRSAEK